MNSSRSKDRTSDTVRKVTLTLSVITSGCEADVSVSCSSIRSSAFSPSGRHLRGVAEGITWFLKWNVETTSNEGSHSSMSHSKGLEGRVHFQRGVPLRCRETFSEFKHTPILQQAPPPPSSPSPPPHTPLTWSVKFNSTQQRKRFTFSIRRLQSLYLGWRFALRGFFFLLPLSSLSNSAKFNQGFCWRPWVLCLKLRLSSWLRDVKSNTKSFILRYVSKKEEKKCNLVEPVQKIKRASASGRSETHWLPCWGTVVQKQNKKTLDLNCFIIESTTVTHFPPDWLNRAGIYKMWFWVTQFLNGTDQQIKKMLEIRYFFRLESFVERKQIWIIGLPVSLESRHLIFPWQWRSCVFRSLLCLQMCRLFPVPGHRDHMNTYVTFRV